MPYAFTPDDYSRFQEDIIQAGGDQASLTTILSDFQGTFLESKAVVDSTQADMERLTAENQRLKDANMTLFLRVGEQVRQQDTPPQSPPEDEEPKYKNVDEYLTAFFNGKNQKGT